jgi:hypothetical protein
MVGIVTALLSGGYLYAIPAAETERDPSAGEDGAAVLPSGVSKSWFSQAQENIRRSEYDVRRAKCPLPGVGEAYQCPNRACNLRTYFLPDGVRMVRRTESTPTWQVGMRIAECGLQNREKTTTVSLGEPELVIAGNRVEYRYLGITEWYVNDERGLEQGFTIAELGEREDERPGTRNLKPEHSQVELLLELTGNCRAEQTGALIAIKAPVAKTADETSFQVKRGDILLG